MTFLVRREAYTSTLRCTPGQRLPYTVIRKALSTHCASRRSQHVRLRFAPFPAKRALGFRRWPLPWFRYQSILRRRIVRPGCPEDVCGVPSQRPLLLSLSSGLFLASWSPLLDLHFNRWSEVPCLHSSDGHGRALRTRTDLVSARGAGIRAWIRGAQHEARGPLIAIEAERGDAAGRIGVAEHAPLAVSTDPDRGHLPTARRHIRSSPARVVDTRGHLRRKICDARDREPYSLISGSVLATSSSNRSVLPHATSSRSLMNIAAIS